MRPTIDPTTRFCGYLLNLDRALEFEGYSPAALLHPYNWGNEFDPTMKKILELPQVLIIGCNVVGDVHKIRKRFSVR